MPPKLTTRNITACFAVALKSLEALADHLNTPFLRVISTTIQSLLENLEAVKQNRNECTLLMEQTHGLLDAITSAHTKSDTGGDLSVDVLNHMGKFSETLNKIHTFIEAQQNKSKIKRFFRQGEMSTLLKECKAGLQEGIDFFQIKSGNLMNDIEELQKESEMRHQEVLNMIETLSGTSSDQESTISGLYSCSYNSSNSISMLPSEPKIFHGRDPELSDILQLFHQNTPRIAILGAGGMGKTSLAQAVIHHPEIVARYGLLRFFVTCDSITTEVQLAALIGAHLGLESRKDLTRPVFNHLSRSLPTLLILDNFETPWEPRESRGDVEEFLSLLTDVKHLALMITMRGAERPAKVSWSRPFLRPLTPLEHDAALQTFHDIADGLDQSEVDKILSLADNMPLAINLLAHLVDSEGCSDVLARWEQEKTTLISAGHDRRSNLEFSISLSLLSPRINTVPGTQELLSLLSILPDGLSDTELLQSRLPIPNILECKTALVRTALAYTDRQKRTKVLVPIREYVHKIQPPPDHLIRLLLQHFGELLELYTKYSGTQSNSGIRNRTASNYANIQNVILNGLQEGHPDLVNSIYCLCRLNSFSIITGQGKLPVFIQIPRGLLQSCNARLEVYYITQLFGSWGSYPISDPKTLISQAKEHFEDLNDEDLKCKFYLNVSIYYRDKELDLPVALTYGKTALSLAICTGNTRGHSESLDNLAWIQYILGNYSTAQLHICESQRLASTLADFYQYSQSLYLGARCCMELGNYKKSISVCNQGIKLLGLCNMSQDRPALDSAIGICLGVSKEELQKNLDVAASAYMAVGFNIGVGMCDTVSASVLLQYGDTAAAKALFQRCLKLFSGHSAITSYCLEQLSDMSRWHAAPDWQPSWPTVFLVHSLKSRQKLGIHQALQYIGDALAEDDEDTAISLFTAALEGFTDMDVHCSRAECMLRLGDICRQHNNCSKAIEHWTTARPLFKRSSQGKRVEDIDTRLTSVGEYVLEHRNNSGLSVNS
ncbi:hypothetical protein DFH08DRAFT_936977 [Mycena albidolilacea]|uniref:NACHT domain-containing protein n=1 Tax=Mycena albidolilacea TaxID=1033008 RepID=A0AAD7ESA7_9AGAR|nr:hypothetical protein DFH08DRAFT_936977 [Mycena albidolilacea]